MICQFVPDEKTVLVHHQALSNLFPKNFFVDTGMDKTFKNVNIFYK